MVSLIPGAFYWARSERHDGGRVTVVQVSNVFGHDPQYRTLIAVGSEQHHMIEDIQLLAHIDLPGAAEVRQAAE
jgi:hypothetical protein